MDKAKVYFLAKRLNKKMASAYKTSFDVYTARWAQYNGTKGTHITADSTRALWVAGDALVTKVKANGGVSGLKEVYDLQVAATKIVYDIYKTKEATFKAAVIELAAQKALAAQAVTDAGTAATALAAVKKTTGDKDNLTYKGGKDGKTDTDTVFNLDAKATKASGTATTTYNDAKKAYDAAKKLATEKKAAAKATVTAITELRTAATKAATATTTAADDAAKARVIVDAATTGKQAVVDAAVKTLAEKVLACKEKKWDTYKSNLTKAEAQRDTDITAIKKLLKDRADAAPKYVKGAGAKGARCEKAMTAGSMGPRRGAQTCTAETDCCGAAKKLDATTGLLMTVEVCWPKTEKKYKYQPPRAPMQLKMPATEDDWTFACIEGAQKLVAASAALATAAYMMA